MRLARILRRPTCRAKRAEKLREDRGRRFIRHPRAVLPLGAHPALHRCHYRTPHRTRVRWLSGREPTGRGQRREILRSASIPVETGICEDECRRLNEVFFHYITNRTPYVVLKYAMTLDGKIAAASGDSRWVTGEAARRHVHETRAHLSGIMVAWVLCWPTIRCSPAVLKADATRTASFATATRAHLWTVNSSSRAGNRHRHRRDRMERACCGTQKSGRACVLCQSQNGKVDLNDLMHQLGAHDWTVFCSKAARHWHSRHLKQALYIRCRRTSHPS